MNFSYSELPTDWNSEPQKSPRGAWARSRASPSRRSRRSIYRVTQGGKSVTFALNDLSQVKPPAGLLGADEKFLGPVFDEFGIRFFLVFNARLKIFHFVLDETAPAADEFVAAQGSDRS